MAPIGPTTRLEAGIARIWVLTAVLGLQVGEVLVLRGSDLDFERKINVLQPPTLTNWNKRYRTTGSGFSPVKRLTGADFFSNLLCLNESRVSK